MIDSGDFKKAVARIFYDMLSADGYIRKEEVDLLDNLKSNETGYDISLQDVYDSQFLSFCDALNILSEWKQMEMNGEPHSSRYSTGRFFLDLISLAKADGSISPNETRIVLAVFYVIERGARCFSIPKSELRLSKKEVVYVDIDDETGYDEEIDENYSLYKSMLSLYGFKFIHIPHELSFLQSIKGDGLLTKVMQLSAPEKRYDETSVAELISTLGDTTTSNVVEHFLNTDSSRSNVVEPSLLFKVRTSKKLMPSQNGIIKMQSYGDYICLPVSSSVREAIEDLINQIMRHNNRLVHQVNTYSEEYLSIRGFHKTLLDYLLSKASNRGIGDVVIVRGRKSEIRLTGLNQIISLKTKELCLYMTMIYFSAEHNGLPSLDSLNIDAKRAQAVFAAIYSQFSGREDSPEIYDIKGFGHSLSLIRKEIDDVEKKCATLLKQFRPAPKDDNPNLFVDVSYENVFVKMAKNDKPIALKDWMSQIVVKSKLKK